MEMMDGKDIVWQLVPQDKSNEGEGWWRCVTIGKDLISKELSDILKS